MSNRPTPTEAEQARAEHESAAEQHVAELVRAVDARAPQALHRRVQEMVDAHPAARRRERAGAGTQARKGILGGTLHGRLRPTLAAMAVAAIAGAALALLTGGGAQHRSTQPAGPSLSAATRLTLSAATTGAPSESTAHAAQLNVAVDGIAFPYWEERFGWRASGSRTDTLGGRSVRTVFYSGPHGRRIGYAIVGGTPAPAMSGGTIVWHRGNAYRLQQVGAVPVVTWQRHGRLCVLSGRGVSGATLVRLASWSKTGTAT
jgi:hypothetical protein